MELEPVPLLFAVHAVRKADGQPLLVTGLTFGRLMEEVVMPFEAGDTFILDGAAVAPTQLNRIKVVRQDAGFEEAWHKLHHSLRWGDLKQQDLYARQYHVRIEALLREAGHDVTPQILNAYTMVIKPRLRDYLPSREALLKSAVEFYVATMRALS